MISGDIVYPLTGPTRYLPGTPQKVAVMRDRASRRRPIFHPQDATLSHSLAQLLGDDHELVQRLLRRAGRPAAPMAIKKAA